MDRSRVSRAHPVSSPGGAISTTAGAGAPSRSAILRVSVRSSIRFRKPSRSPGTASRISRSSSPNGSSMSQSSCTSRLDSSICARCSISVCRRLGCLISSARSSSSSSDAEFLDQLRGRLDPDARRARHVVHAVAGQRLHVDHAVGRHAELLEHAVVVDPAVLHRVKHLDAAADQLHEVLVGRQDGDAAARVPCPVGKGGDDVVRLEPLDLLAGDVERPRRLPGQRDLRAQVLGHFGTVGLVEVVHVVAERVRALVEDHRRMRRRVRSVVALHVAVEHAAETRDRPDRQPVRLAGERRQGVEGPEDVGRAVDEVKVMSLAESHGAVPR